MRILAIETSCDETAAAVVEDGAKVLSNVIASQIELHKLTGGVVPEVAAREHAKQLPYIYEEALSAASLKWSDIDAIAATETPGLTSSLLVGVQTARTLASVHKKQYLAVNHIEGHIFSNWLGRKSNEIEFPVLVLTVSGGHNSLYLVKSFQEIELLGQTQDDAAGEAFDKVAKMLGLAYPGGPEIAKLAEAGDPQSFKFPRAELDNPYDFSFSGLKTSVLYKLRDLGGSIDEETKANIAASFELTVAQTLSKKLIQALEEHQVKEIHLAGGVSANLVLRSEIAKELEAGGFDAQFRYPTKMSYCTDNAAMIAAAAYFRQQDA